MQELWRRCETILGIKRFSDFTFVLDKNEMKILLTTTVKYRLTVQSQIIQVVLP